MTTRKGRGKGTEACEFLWGALKQALLPCHLILVSLEQATKSFRNCVTSENILFAALKSQGTQQSTLLLSTAVLTENRCSCLLLSYRDSSETIPTVMPKGQGLALEVSSRSHLKASPEAEGGDITC